MPLHPALVVFFSAIVCFIFCVGADVVRRLLFYCFHKPIDRVLAAVDAKSQAFQMGG